MYDEQVKRIQITKDWKEKSINQEILESDKLEKFIEVERMRSHFVAHEIHLKQIEAEQRRLNLIKQKDEEKEARKKANKEAAERAEGRVQE